MRMLVLGAGLQGCACALDLLDTSDAEVTLADSLSRQLPPALESYRGRRLSVIRLDVEVEKDVRDVMGRHDAVMSAAPYYFNYDLARAAVAAGIHFSDLGGNTEIVRRQETLNDEATRKGLSIMPDCGLAPGMVNIIAVEAIRRLDAADRVMLYVGGLPRDPQPPLNYQIVYSLEGALDYYTTPSWVIRDGQPAQVDALSEVEEVSFPAPIGTLEAFHTGGGVSTMPWVYAGKVEAMEYKTLRYPGHAHIMRAIRGLGLLDLRPVDVKGTPVRPRDAFIATVDPKLRRPDAPDLVALQVSATGRRNGAPASVTFQLLDFSDDRKKMSAMMRTTGYSLSITGQMQADGRVTLKGVRPAYEAMPFAEYVSELRKRHIKVEEVSRH